MCTCTLAQVCTGEYKMQMCNKKGAQNFLLIVKCAQHVHTCCTLFKVPTEGSFLAITPSMKPRLDSNDKNNRGPHRRQLELRLSEGPRIWHEGAVRVNPRPPDSRRVCEPLTSRRRTDRGGPRHLGWAVRDGRARASAEIRRTVSRGRPPGEVASSIIGSQGLHEPR